MADIFEQKISCRKCNVEMKPCVLNKNGAQLRAVRCLKCGNTIIHPADLNTSTKFNDLKGKTFSVKLRMVGNSHAISIPKEIVEFMNSMHNSMNSQHNQMTRHMDEMVKLCLRDFNSLSLNFGNAENDNINGAKEKEKEVEEMRGARESREAREVKEMGALKNEKRRIFG